MGGGFEVLPEGEYVFEIIEIGEKETKNLDPMAMLVLKVSEGEYQGRKVWDNIVIPNEGSPSFKIMGRTKHFWHCIGEPYEGDVEWNTGNWLHKKVRAKVKHETQTQGKYAGQLKATIESYIFDESLNQIAWDDAPAL
jgi:hypothetical protein